MDITPLISPDRNIIKSYGDSGFTINEDVYDGSIIISPMHIEPWGASLANGIDIDSLSDLDKFGDIEILLIGCGETHMQLPQDLAIYFFKKNIGLEIMTTGSACRTYNVLLSEERSVVAAMIAV